MTLFINMESKCLGRCCQNSKEQACSGLPQAVSLNVAHHLSRDPRPSLTVSIGGILRTQNLEAVGRILEESVSPTLPHHSTRLLVLGEPQGKSHCWIGMCTIFPGEQEKEQFEKHCLEYWDLPLPPVCLCATSPPRVLNICALLAGYCSALHAPSSSLIWTAAITSPSACLHSGPLTIILHSVARENSQKHKSNYILLPKVLQWFPVALRIKHKILILVYKAPYILTPPTSPDRWCSTLPFLTSPLPHCLSFVPALSHLRPFGLAVPSPAHSVPPPSLGWLLLSFQFTAQRGFFWPTSPKPRHHF